MNVLFLGRKAVAAEALSWLVSQEGVNVVGVVTDSHIDVSPTREAAEYHSIRLYSQDEVEYEIASGKLDIELTLSMLYWRKIREPVISTTKRGVINFHPAPLPSYKGTAGYNMAIMEGLDEWAVSAHYVDSDIDTGPIIKVSAFPIDPVRETALTLERKTRPELLKLFIYVVSKALRSSSPLDSRPNVGGRYITRREMEAMKEIKLGDDIERKVRAFWFPPYDGAWIDIDGHRCTLVTSQILHALGSQTENILFAKDEHYLFDHETCSSSNEPEKR